MRYHSKVVDMFIDVSLFLVSVVIILDGVISIYKISL